VERFSVIGGSGQGRRTVGLGTVRASARAAAWILPVLLLGAPLAAHAVCGDTIVDAGEDCDDGNTADGDCCAADCTFEGTQLVFPAVEDTYTDGEFRPDAIPPIDERNKNFDTSAHLRVDADPERNTYLKFTVSGTAGLVIGRAKVRLTTTGTEFAGSNDGGTIHLVSDNGWSEHTLTHNNRPAIDGPALDSAGPVDDIDSAEFDVTVAVNGDGTYSFGITSESENVVRYASKDGEGVPPQLIVFAGPACDDGDACTQRDACTDGACLGLDPVVCTAVDDCHDAGTCDSGTGDCSNPTKADGSACDDGDGCTQTDTCSAGSCVGANPVICPDPDQCHDAGTCNPGTGLCSNPAKADGTACNDGSACTLSDTCITGACTGADPIICTASDQCHNAGTCDPATGVCSDPAKADGAACSDGNACTQSDTCMAGACASGTPLTCTASDQCHVAGTCNPATGLCSNPAKADGSACNDGNACTLSDTCTAGACTGANPVVCAASDQCHLAGACSPATGLCSNPAKADGSACNDGNACTGVDTCIAGTCAGANAIICTASDQCHQAGSCNPATGLCSNPATADGSACDDGDTCSDADRCIEGQCIGDQLPDTDGDGFCDPGDVCPFISDAAQLDQNGDGIGDLCQCTASAPGRCIVGGGSKKTDCDMEFLSIGPTALNGTKLKPEFRCADGDAACDLDGARDGKCTMGVSICFGNSDPRLPKCAAERVRSIEVLSPKADATLEGALAALGLEVRRKKQVISEAAATLGNDFCSPLVTLVVPTAGGKPVKKNFSLRASSTSGRVDADKFRLVCQ